MKLLKKISCEKLVGVLPEAKAANFGITWNPQL